MVFIGLGENLLFKSVLAHCAVWGNWNLPRETGTSLGEPFSMIQIIYFFKSISGEQEFESYDSNTIDTFNFS